MAAGSGGTHSNSGNHNNNTAGGGVSSFPDEQIIRLVRQHSCLYNPREQEYKDADRKAAVWREIAANVGMTAVECEHRWRYLRDRYTRERKRKSQQNGTSNKSGGGGGGSGGGNWPLASEMHFIQDFIKHRSFKIKAGGGGSSAASSTGANYSGAAAAATTTGEARPATAVAAMSQQRHHHQVKVEGDNNCHSSSGEETDGQSSPGFDQQSAAAECYPMVIIEEETDHNSDRIRPDSPSEFRHQQNDLRDRSVVNNDGSPRMTYNEDELFCLSVAQTLRRLPMMRRSLAKVQILQLIHDMEFGGGHS